MNWNHITTYILFAACIFGYILLFYSFGRSWTKDDGINLLQMILVSIAGAVIFAIVIFKTANDLTVSATIIGFISLLSGLHSGNKIKKKKDDIQRKKELAYEREQQLH